MPLSALGDPVTADGCLHGGDIVSASGIKLLRVALWNNAIRIHKQRWSGLHLAHIAVDFERNSLAVPCLEREHICDTHGSPCGAGDSARRDVSQVHLTAMCLIFRP